MQYSNILLVKLSLQTSYAIESMLQDDMRPLQENGHQVNIAAVPHCIQATRQNGL